MTTSSPRSCPECSELRARKMRGVCIDCHRQAALNEVRTGSLNRIWQAMCALWTGDRHQAHYALQMAWERATNTGDYAPDGHFDKRYLGWRDCDPCHIQNVENMATRRTNRFGVGND